MLVHYHKEVSDHGLVDIVITISNIMVIIVIEPMISLEHLGEIGQIQKAIYLAVMNNSQLPIQGKYAERVAIFKIPQSCYACSTIIYP